MFDRLDLFREDTPTPARPTPKPARADAAPDERAHPRQERAGAPRQDRDHAAPDDRDRHERAGHRREQGARDRPRRTRTQRTRAAIADVGLYRAVSYTDLSEQHFDGHPFTTRRLVTQMKQAGLIEEHEATGPRGIPTMAGPRLVAGPVLAGRAVLAGCAWSRLVRARRVFTRRPGRRRVLTKEIQSVEHRDRLAADA